MLTDFVLLTPIPSLHIFEHTYNYRKAIMIEVFIVLQFMLVNCRQVLE